MGDSLTQQRLLGCSAGGDGKCVYYHKELVLSTLC